MKTGLFALCLAAVLANSWNVGHCAQTATVSLANSSVTINGGKCSCGFGLDYYMYFSSFYTEEVSFANGEVAPNPTPGSYSHWSFMLLQDVSLWVSVTPIELNLPMGDPDRNGKPDFFEVAKPCQTSSSGIYHVNYGSGPKLGTIRFDWYRPAGESAGSCTITMVDPVLGTMGPFRNTFELTSYTGSLTYVPSAGTVDGLLSLSGSGVRGTELSGPVQFTKPAVDPGSLITLQVGTLTNSTFGEMPFSEAPLTRDSGAPNSYRGTLQATDGSYRTWTLVIVDNNDADHDGIPDLGDAPATPPPSRPGFSVQVIGNSLRFAIAGDLGRTHLVQEADSPDASTWSTVQTMVLTNGPQTVDIPLPSGKVKFWRVQAK